MKDALNTKLYYSISEVAEITSLPSYTLRAWEKEFTCLRPRRVHGKNRAYRRRDVGIILVIKRLLYEERYTIQGVRQKLKSETELVRLASEQAIAELLAADPGTEEAEVVHAKTDGAGSQVGAESGIREGAGGTDEDREVLKRWIETTRRDLHELLSRLS